MAFDLDKAYKDFNMGVQGIWGAPAGWQGNEANSLQAFLSNEGTKHLSGSHSTLPGQLQTATMKAWAQDILNQSKGGAASGINWDQLAKSNWTHGIESNNKDWMKNTFQPAWNNTGTNWIDLIRNAPAGSVGGGRPGWENVRLTADQFSNMAKSGVNNLTPTQAMQMFGGSSTPQPQVLPGTSGNPWIGNIALEGYLNGSYLPKHKQLGISPFPKAGMGGGAFGNYAPSWNFNNAMGSIESNNKDWMRNTFQPAWNNPDTKPNYGYQQSYNPFGQGFFGNPFSQQYQKPSHQQPNYPQMYGYPQQLYTPFSSPFAFSNQNKQNTANIWGNNSIWKA